MARSATRATPSDAPNLQFPLGPHPGSVASLVPSTRSPAAKPHSPTVDDVAAQQPQSTADDSIPTRAAASAPRPFTVAGLHRLLNTEEACTYLDCHYRTILRHIETGRLKAYRLGRLLKFRQEDLDAVLEPVNAGPAAADDLDDFISKHTRPTAS